ncbi:beta strand repeat-containing protein [Nitrosopumilus sp.]|uniref:beta strand repeat-containing protein n=1 Tax=Nitrosopumilus sp. TaxID=2024843 RepID=UPI003D0C8A07
MKWEIPLLVSFVLLLGIFSSFPVLDSNFTIDENGLKHYVLTPEKNISSFDVVATSLSKYNREIDFDEQDPYFVFFLFVLLLVLLYRSNFVLQVKHSVLKTFASDYINLFLKNNFAQTLFSENKINLKEIFVVLSSSNVKLQNNSFVLCRNCSNVLINSKKFFVSKKIIVVLLLFVVLVVPVYNHAYADSGDITKSLVDSFEFNNSYGSYPFIVQVDSDTFAISYQGVNNEQDGYIQTFDITSAGIITSKDTLEFQPHGITFSSIVQIDSDTFAIAYRDTASGDGFIQTVDISGTGTITNGTAYEFDTASGNDPHIVAVDSDTFAVAYQGGGNDGWLKTLNISADGSTITQEDQFEYDNSNGRDNDIIRVDSDTFLVVHRGVDNDGFARTINVSTDGTINSIEDTLEFEPTFDAFYNDVTQIDSDTFAVAYRDVDNDGRLVTLDVTSTGTITLVETLEYETVDASWPDIIKLDDKSVVIAYRGTGNDGFIKTIPITVSGDIGAITDTYEFDGGAGQYPSIFNIDGNTVAIATRGPGSDGWLDTIFIDVELTGTDTISVAETDDSTKLAVITASSTPTVISNGINSVNPVLNPVSTPVPSHGFSLAIYASSTPVPAHEVTISTIKTNDTFEFDNAHTDTPDLVQVDTDTFAVVYRGVDADGFIKTVNIDSTGTITDTGNSLEFDTADGWTPNIVPVDTDTFAVVYNGTDTDGFIKTLNISGAGVITDTGNSLEFDTVDGLYPDIIAVDSDTFAIVYTGTGNDGFIKTLNITGAGAITDTGNSLEFDTAQGLTPDIVAVDSDTFVISYTGNGNDGFVKTVDITGAGVISSVIDTLEYDTTASYDTSILKIDADTFVVASRGAGSDGFIDTFDIDSSGNISNSITDTLEFDTGTGHTPDIVSLGSDTYGIAYRGGSNDGFFVIVTIDNAGNIGSSVDESLEYNTTNGYNPSIIAVDLNTYAIAHRGNGNDGFITTIDTSNELAFSDSDTLDVAESVDLVKKYAISGTSTPVPADSAITTGNSIIDDANSTPAVTSSATAFKGYFLNANSTPSVSDSGNTVAQYTRTASDVLDVAEQNTEFKNYTRSGSSTPNIASNGVISFSINANSTPAVTSTATPSADISGSTTPTVTDNATTVAMFVLNPSTIPSVSSIANIAFTLSANSTPVPSSTATPSADISGSSTPAVTDNAQQTVMFVLSGSSTPAVTSTATPSADLSANTTPAVTDNAQQTVMFVLSGSSTPAVTSTATPSADISGSSTPAVTDNAQQTVMFVLSGSSTPSVTSTATPSADISGSSTPAVTDNAQQTVMFVLSGSSTPSVTSTATPSADLSANTTPAVTDNAQQTVMFVLSGSSTPSVTSTATPSASFNSSSN